MRLIMLKQTSGKPDPRLGYSSAHPTDGHEVHIPREVYSTVIVASGFSCLITNQSPS